jgi:hypothetical protein
VVELTEAAGRAVDLRATAGDVKWWNAGEV